MGVVGGSVFFHLIPETAKYYVLYVFYLFILLARILYCPTLRLGRLGALRQPQHV